jgi:Ca2+-binding RTX toxin-like protein
MARGIKRGLLPASMLVALAAGVLTAVLVSGASAGGAGFITLTGEVEKRLTILGSESDEALTVRGEAAGNVMLNADRSFTNMRTDCTTMGPATTNAVCESEYATIDADFADGPDKLVFKAVDVQGLVRVLARGARGGDTLLGSDARDRFEGGAGRDELRGRDGDDDLNGGAHKDSCSGGPGQDQITNCE